MSALGNRYECFNCEAKFYDLGKTEAICPSCGANQADEGAEVEEPKPAETVEKKPAAAKGSG